MNDVEIDSLTTADLVKPRENLPWDAEKAPLNCWTKPFLINNRITEVHAEKIQLQEHKGRAALYDLIDGELACLSATKYHFWSGEYRFLEKLMTFKQLATYAPGFLNLSRIMPKKLVFCRRIVVRKYLERQITIKTTFVAKLCRQFVRSSVLLYPAESLMAAADQFISLVKRSADQSRRANRHRVAILLRSLRLMSDHELCDQFQCEREYLDELSLLGELVQHYRLNVEDVFKISADEINRFWETQR